jgi:hypothetical protein
MNSEQFVSVIKGVVIDSTTKSTLSILANPPGRRPNPELLKKSDWYKTLSDQDKKMVESVIAGAVHQAVFGMFAVIDGVRVIDEGPTKADLELFYVKDGERVRLNSPGEEPLHDILNRL